MSPSVSSVAGVSTSSFGLVGTTAFGLAKKTQLKSHFHPSSSYAQHVELSFRAGIVKPVLVLPSMVRDTASRGLTTIVTAKSQFRTDPTDHDSIGYPRAKASGESSTTKHRLLHASGPHPIPPPSTPTESYNQDLGLIHSTNGNHLESPNEGSSIDHQVTIHLHAQNITMFPTNETWYFTSQAPIM
ncbi:U-box domain-containing protein 44-like [Dorcoceras hygrometricum]|uniref:U-box domain-containing protein 44-like n=1 Tax=Dorcoceras hygrometricum TaxID=472368 RepID=A0A2Z7CCQ1_9LAMI|nr:U-box domain-containing protein 44-like [Dorcoceras hygrometricum]